MNKKNLLIWYDICKGIFLGTLLSVLWMGIAILGFDKHGLANFFLIVMAICLLSGTIFHEFDEYFEKKAKKVIPYYRGDKWDRGKL